MSSEGSFIFYNFKQKIRDVLKDRVTKFFEIDSDTFPNLSTKIPTIKEWKKGGFEEADVFIDKIFPSEERNFPAIVIGVSGIAQNPIGIGDLVGFYDGDDGTRYRRKGININADISFMLGTRDEGTRESMCDFLIVMLSRLSHDRINGNDYWLEINDDVSVSGFAEEDLSGISSIEKIYSAEISFSIVMEGYEDTAVDTVLGLGHASYDQYDSTDFDGNGNLTPAQDDTIY